MFMSCPGIAARCRSLLPASAFLASAALAVLLAAQAQLACTRQIVMPIRAGMAEMHMAHTMAMPAANVLSLCPVVVALALAAVILTAWSAAAFVADPHRRTAGRVLLRDVARLPLRTIAGSVLVAGSSAVALMIAADGSAPAGIGGWLLLAAVVTAVAISAATCAAGFVRAALALSQRVVLVIAASLTQRSRDTRIPGFNLYLRPRAAAHPVPPLAARRGLRAPPLPIR
jgi:hypothetical protein